jgi:serine/threonine protein kinase
MVKLEVVGEGTYGCVIKPSLKCKNDSKINYKNTVSKVMRQIDAKKELNEYKSLNLIKGIEKYAITSPTICKPIMDDTFLDIVKKCNTKKVKDVYNTNKSNLSMLILQDGGINLYSYLKKIFTKTTQEEQKIFFTSLINLIDGLLFFKTKDIMHRDIKLLNIVYNINEGKSKFIDFGLMTKMTTFINKCKSNKENYAISWNYFPPENSCGNITNFYIYPKCKNYSSYYSYDNFLKHLSNNFDLYCLSLAFNDLIKILHHLKICNQNFIKDFFKLIEKYIVKNPIKRNTNISELKKNYTELLYKYDLYSKKIPKISSKVESLVKELSSNEIVKDISEKNETKKILKECKEPKPIYNSITNRCISKCKNGYIRDEKYKCVKNKTQKKTLSEEKKNTFIKKSVSKNSIKNLANKHLPTPELEKKCKKLNKDLNPYTRRCNMKCKPNQVRDSKFKCVSNNN